MRGDLVHSFLTLFAGEFCFHEDPLGVPAGESLVEVADFDPGFRVQPFAEFPRLDRFLALLAVAMNGQAHDEEDDLFLGDEPAKPLGVQF